MASSILITDSKEIADMTAVEVEKFLKELEREEIARKSIEERGAIIVTNDIDEAISLMNEIAPRNTLRSLRKTLLSCFLKSNTPERFSSENTRRSR